MVLARFFSNLCVSNNSSTLALKFRSLGTGCKSETRGHLLSQSNKEFFEKGEIKVENIRGRSLMIWRGGGKYQRQFYFSLWKPLEFFFLWEGLLTIFFFGEAFWSFFFIWEGPLRFFFPGGWSSRFFFLEKGLWNFFSLPPTQIINGRPLNHKEINKIE